MLSHYSLVAQYVDADGNKQFMACTQFQALDARRAFVCWDEPAIKATFSVVFIIENHLTALFNMPEINTEYINGGKKKITFDRTPIMSTYIVAYAVGQFDYVSGKTKNDVVVRVLSPPGRALQGKFALNIGIKCIDFYNEYFQVNKYQIFYSSYDIFDLI